jgi:hypothetical protein
MNYNISNTDRIIRFLIFVLAIILFLFDILSGWTAYISISVGTILLVTSLLSFCPIYKILGISTFHKKTKTKNQLEQ